MSDSYIRLIPDDQRWQPTVEAAASAAAYVAELFYGQGDAVERVEVTFYDRVTLIDAGEYTTRIACSRCEADISLDWLGDVVRENGGASFDSLDVLVPCCGAAAELDSLHYEEPIRFARFEVSAMNPTRARSELDGTELARVAQLLGHPVVQVLAHY
ncbi:hypothetical protein Q3W71_16425 [Micromonospora sp. C28SCA-DRY-2]|uniref:hypothetical protein n=1 Tax=Micromonospora sp. C28SCA-DRY-2 TaxID=3059522 RepID=UPI0026757BE8|nr:hypothetical protein [Micromonospora sp. C28SCA-DRY-2]MDO3703260.1 hypothetical protein [Micromonospora sp. C28SCA-DRY-2]